MFIGAFVGAVLIEGFATLIGKSFAITGRVQDQGVRRLQQNNAHLPEIFLPQGMDRENDGWKLSVRIRLMHARVRASLNRSDEWDQAAWGVPLSAAHIGFATAAFSGLLLTRARSLGVHLSPAETESFMMIRRHSGHLMGVEPAWRMATEAQALRLHRIGGMCEPPPNPEAVPLANTLINSAPLPVGAREPAARRKLAAHIHRVSRALIGHDMADALRCPPSRSFGVLATFRLRNRVDGLLRRMLPAMGQRRRAGQFSQMLDLSFHRAGGLDYRLPELLYAERDRVE